MTPDQINALHWVLMEAIDFSNERRPDLSLEDAASEHRSLCQILDLIEPHDAALAGELRKQLGEIAP